MALIAEDGELCSFISPQLLLPLRPLLLLSLSVQVGSLVPHDLRRGAIRNGSADFGKPGPEVHRRTAGEAKEQKTYQTDPLDLHPQPPYLSFSISVIALF